MGRNVLASMIGVAANPRSLAASARPAVQKRAGPSETSITAITRPKPKFEPTL